MWHNVWHKKATHKWLFIARVALWHNSPVYILLFIKHSMDMVCVVPYRYCAFLCHSATTYCKRRKIAEKSVAQLCHTCSTVPQIERECTKLIKLRDYQQECIDILDKKGRGSWLVQMATGLGKTVTFANLKRQGRMLILSHREELVRQPLKYFTCSTGVEMAADKSTGDEVVYESVQSIVRRLSRFGA